MNDIYRKTYAEINLRNLYSNYMVILDRLNNKEIIPVVKANAYGHGDIEVVQYLHDNGVDRYAVSLLEEALKLRKYFFDIEILVMGVVHPNQFLIASKNNITITISNFDQLDGVIKLKCPIKVHLKVDTGMNRLGFKKMKEIDAAIKILNQTKHVILEGLYTHFATADDNYEYYTMQLHRFQAVIEHVEYPFKIIHISNSSSMIKYENEYDFTTHTRLGISLYGLTLDEETKFLKNTYRLITHVSEIKKLSPGEKVGYGATYTASDNEIIGILPIGYADGFIRANSKGDVEINGKRYPIIGRICMDQMFIKIDDSITINDDVILMGGLISIDEVANRLNTINYEVICQITYRVPKVYIR